MLQLTEVDFGNEFDFNFTLYNQMGSNLKASNKLEKFVIEGCKIRKASIFYDPESCLL